MTSDAAIRISVPCAWADVAGTLLMELLGPFQEVVPGETAPGPAGGLAGTAASSGLAAHAGTVARAGTSADIVHLLFYPFRHGAGYVSDEELLGALPDEPGLRSSVIIERVLVPGGWEENWKLFFRPLKVGRLYIRPPWEPGPPAGESGLLDVVLTPGLAFGTGLHATTRSILELLQHAPAEGPLVDAGTGSGILAISAARLGYRPVCAFDNDPLAVEAARVNAADNSVEVEVVEAAVLTAPLEWFRGATILANITLDPVVELIRRLQAEGVDHRRLLVAGILAGEQEPRVLEVAREAGLSALRSLHEGEWAAMDLRKKL